MKEPKFVVRGRAYRNCEWLANGRTGGSVRVHLPEGPVKVDCSDFESLLDHTTAKNGHLQLRSGLFNGVDYCACPPDKHVAVADNEAPATRRSTVLQCPAFIDELFLSLFPHRLQLHNTRFIYSLPW